MKKIKLLRIVILTLLVYIIFRLITIMLNVPSEHKISALISNTPILFFTGLMFIERGLKLSLKKGYFNNMGIKKFKYAGYFFISSGFLGFLLGLFYLIKQNNSVELRVIMHQKISFNFCVLIVGIGILIFSDMIKKGYFVQKENDLTI